MFKKKSYIVAELPEDEMTLAPIISDGEGIDVIMSAPVYINSGMLGIVSVNSFTKKFLTTHAKDILTVDIAEPAKVTVMPLLGCYILTEAGNSIDIDFEVPEPNLEMFEDRIEADYESKSISNLDEALAVEDEDDEVDSDGEPW